MTTHQPIDVAIIGGGPAGYAAAIYAARSNLTTTVIEQGMSGGQIATTNEVENYPGIPLLSGAELGERFQQHAEGLGAQVTWSMVTGIDYDADAALFTVHHDMGDTLASSVIACMGATPRPAGFAGEDTYRGRGVSYCATCDGMFFRGKQVFVVGGGYAAAEESVFLTKYASHVTCLVRGDDFTPQWTLSYMGALLYLALFGSVIAFGAYFTLVGRIGAGKAAYSTLLFPLVALTISTFYEGYVWHSNAVIGLALILVGNLVMFARPEQWFLRRRLA